MLPFIESLDETLFLFFNGYHTPLLDNIMSLVTGRFIWIPMYAMILLILMKNFKPKHALIYALGIIVAVTVADQLCSTVLRPLFHRLRPSNPDNPFSEFAILVNGYRGGKYGFPSCHAANSFALATFLSLLIKRRRFIIFISCWAFINAFSRLYLGVHYPFDLLVGGVIGIMSGMSLYMICSYATTRHFTRNQLKQNPKVSIPLLYSIVGANHYLRPTDIMIGAGGITFLTIIFMSILK